MKDRLIILFIFAAAIFSMGFFCAAPQNTAEASVFPREVRLKLTQTDEIITLTAEEYLSGCICAQIPIDYEQEALNAQGAAAATYALRLMRDFADGGQNAPADADLTDNARICQPYYSPEQCVELYGEYYSDNLPKIAAAARYGLEHIITYEGEPVYAVYHSVSAGRTCSAEPVWGRDFPYLKAVDSEFDKSFINFECINEMTTEQACVKLIEYKSDIEIPADFSKWFSQLNANEDGYVISVRIGKNVFSGGDIWRIFGIRSTAFTVSYSSGIFTFKTKGYGHGAGMSQYGANEMAKRGYTAADILAHYYGDSVSLTP